MLAVLLYLLAACRSSTGCGHYVGRRCAKAASPSPKTRSMADRCAVWMLRVCSGIAFVLGVVASICVPILYDPSISDLIVIACSILVVFAAVMGFCAAGCCSCSSCDKPARVPTHAFTWACAGLVTTLLSAVGLIVAQYFEDIEYGGANVLLSLGICTVVGFALIWIVFMLRFCRSTLLLDDANDTLLIDPSATAASTGTTADAAPAPALPSRTPSPPVVEPSHASSRVAVLPSPRLNDPATSTEVTARVLPEPSSVTVEEAEEETARDMTATLHEPADQGAVEPVLHGQSWAASCRPRLQSCSLGPSFAPNAREAHLVFATAEQAELAIALLKLHGMEAIPQYNSRPYEGAEGRGWTMFEGGIAATTATHFERAKRQGALPERFARADRARPKLVDISGEDPVDVDARLASERLEPLKVLQATNASVRASTWFGNKSKVQTMMNEFEWDLKTAVERAQVDLLSLAIDPSLMRTRNRADAHLLIPSAGETHVPGVGEEGEVRVQVPPAVLASHKMHDDYPQQGGGGEADVRTSTNTSSPRRLDGGSRAAAQDLHVGAPAAPPIATSLIDNLSDRFKDFSWDFFSGRGMPTGPPADAPAAPVYSVPATDGADLLA